MSHSNVFTLGATAVMAAGSFSFASAPATAKDRPVVVTAPLEDPAVPTRRVSFRDLNLTTNEGQKTLMRRVKNAVTIVCLESTYSSDLVAEHKCRRFAWKGALPQVDRAMQREIEIASTGSSSIATSAITIAIPE